MQEDTIQAFIKQFGTEPTFLIRSPGRVNLIGEHTDYNDGFVLPMAIDRAVWLALRPRTDGRVFLRSLAQAEPAEFALSDIQHRNEGWQEYVKGMAVMLQRSGYDLAGWEGVLCSDVPIGSGLSSSAALEMGVGYAFSVVSQFPFDGIEMARLGQKNENEWIGANTGIMDQLISANGLADKALFIDCRTLAMQPIPLPKETAIVIMNTMTRHSHTDSGYNERRASCEQVAAFFEVTHLRDDFEVTNDALNTMVTIAQSQPGCFGARMSGGGFGGCAVALVQGTKSRAFAIAVAKQYEATTGLSPEIYITTAVNGTAVVPRSS